MEIPIPRNILPRNNHYDLIIDEREALLLETVLSLQHKNDIVSETDVAKEFCQSLELMICNLKSPTEHRSYRNKRDIVKGLGLIEINNSHINLTPGGVQALRKSHHEIYEPGTPSDNRVYIENIIPNSGHSKMAYKMFYNQPTTTVEGILKTTYTVNLDGSYGYSNPYLDTQKRKVVAEADCWSGSTMMSATHDYDTESWESFFAILTETITEENNKSLLQKAQECHLPKGEAVGKITSFFRLRVS